MDKQIIVDGVDVSGCEFCDWKGSDIPQCRIRLASFEPTCKGYNCYYKQLKRKEQECEELEEANNTLTITRKKLLGDLCIVEESLKDYTEHYNRQSEEVDQLKTENEKLKQTLAEIKEIAERGFQHSQCNCGAKADLDLILQKTCEVISE